MSVLCHPVKPTYVAREELVVVTRWPSASHNFDRNLIIILLWFRLCSSGQRDVLYLRTDTNVVEEHAASIFMVGIIRFSLS